MEIRIGEQHTKWLIPGAIIIAGIIIAAAIIYTGRGTSAVAINPQEKAAAEALKLMRPVSDTDHIRGNKDAKVVIVEYSDTECPFCKQFHNTMKQIVAEMGSDVAWVYRHFPLDQLHSKARPEAVALECSAEQGGEDMFWKYTDKVYEVTKSNNTLDLAQLPKIAGDLGMDVSAFNDCLKSGKYDAKIEADVQNAVETGGNGTPWSIMVGKGGKKYSVGGAMPIAQLKALIEKAKTGK